jgi:LysR family hydrogen peroxide-inducible transcriptional activator
VKPIPTLRQLRYLVAVADHRHFGRAAEDCLVTQSTLSAGIQELEALLGVVLIERAKRQVALTPLGDEIVRRARLLLQGAEELADAALAGQRPLVGLLRLGIIPTIGPYLLPPRLKAVRAAYPDLRLYLREDQTARLLDLVGRGRLDAALIALPYETGALERLIIGEDRLWVACPRDHRLAGQATITLADLQGERLLVLEDGHCLRDHALTACHLAPGRANEDFQGTSLGTLVQMVASGLGLTLLPEMAIEVEVRREPNVVALPLDGAEPLREIALVWRPGVPRAADLTRLGTLLAGAGGAAAVTVPVGSDGRATGLR